MSTETLKKPRPQRHCKPSAGVKNKTIYKYLCKWDEIFTRWGWAANTDKQKSEFRHEIITDIFGEYIKPSEFTRTQWDVVFYTLDYLLAHSQVAVSEGFCKFAAEEGMRRVYIHLIETVGKDIPGGYRYGAPVSYIQHISDGKFGTEDWRTLDSRQLQQLFWTLKARLRSAAKAGRSVYREAPAPIAQPEPTSEEDEYPF